MSKLVLNIPDEETLKEFLEIVKEMELNRFYSLEKVNEESYKLTFYLNQRSDEEFYHLKNTIQTGIDALKKKRELLKNL